ncbi:hypothetical protein H257_09061 [Aphanomyces astaci]|uniref:Uncharacterized protein n=1 Tax=Aphanomyces astaci TaxID=112090 RepID=W4GBY6_APHAT|nr:hypothetical protein H257_09061 [Aphanomyces astaci]ETV77175.1 hypothetical protein H257_09061 [Aphanomyces astaci]|eukprot:XP_009833481.1 hypothetical protein H257_09061 [Aphanomyces astaci]
MAPIPLTALLQHPGPAPTLTWALFSSTGGTHWAKILLPLPTPQPPTTYLHSQQHGIWLNTLHSSDHAGTPFMTLVLCPGDHTPTGHHPRLGVLAPAGHSTMVQRIPQTEGLAYHLHPPNACTTTHCLVSRPTNTEISSLGARGPYTAHLHPKCHSAYS